MTEWQIVFWVAFAVFGVTTVIFLIWGDGEVQPWNNPEGARLIENGTGEKEPEDKSESNLEKQIDLNATNKDKN